MNETLTLPTPLTVRIGRWWFQNRSLSPLPLFFLMGVLPAEFEPSAPLVSLCFLVIATAEALRIWAVGYAGSATRTRGDNVPGLVTAGPFRHVRNPLYIANVAMYTAVAVLFGFKYLSLIVFVYSIVQYTFIIRFEESTLGRLFGEPYQNYQARVSRWGIALTPRIDSTPHTFDLRKALRSERSTFFSMGLMAALYYAKRRIGQL